MKKYKNEYREYTVARLMMGKSIPLEEQNPEG